MKREAKFVCTAAVSKARINAHGDIYPCELINTTVVGNLKKQTLAEIWASEYRTQLRGHILGYKPKRCGGCNHVSDCEPCAATRGYNQEGHMEAPISEACMLTTASLVAQGREMAADSPFRKLVGESCVDTILSEGASSGMNMPLVQILRRRASVH
jgi:radical SAM protein with 4Fe4S-binding SPASM domain